MLEMIAKEGPEDVLKYDRDQVVLPAAIVVLDI